MGWLIVRAVLAATFAVSGVAKVASPSATRKSFVSFGVPDVVTAPAAVSLPLLEFMVAGLLLVTPTATVGAWAALGLVAVFTAAMVAALARGEKPECNCFGALSSQRVGVGTLARNALLGLAAGACAIAGPGESIPRAFAGVSAGAVVAVAALLLTLGALTIVSVQLVGQNGRLLARVEALELSLSANVSGGAGQGEGPPVGSPAPDFLLWDEDETVYSLDDLRTPGESIVLAFTDPDCPGCRTVGPLLERAREAGTKVALITRGDREPVPGALRQLDREVMAAYRAHVVPSAVVVDGNGRIGSELARGADAVAGLLASAWSPV
jgi:hypothetical protein